MIFTIILIVALIVVTIAWLWARAEAYVNQKEVIELHQDNERLRYINEHVVADKQESERVFEQEFRSLAKILGQDHRVMREDRERIRHLEDQVTMLRWSHELEEPPQVLELEAGDGTPPTIYTSSDWIP